jgi:hypothetical protein
MNAIKKSNLRVISGIVFSLLFVLFLVLLYARLWSSKIERDKQFYQNLEADGNNIAKALWAYYEEHKQYPKTENLIEIPVSTKFSRLGEWHLSTRGGGPSFILCLWPQRATLRGVSKKLNQIEWRVTPES